MERGWLCQPLFSLGEIEMEIREQETIAAIASGMGGGIGIIRISGENAFSVIDQVFRTKSGNIVMSDKWDTHTVHYGYIWDGDEQIDEVMVIIMKAPNSYTMEDVIEIDAHGGPFVINRILECVCAHGCRLAEPGEFTKRAFLNGRIDLSQAEAVMKMISSKNEFALQCAMNQLEGNVSKCIQKYREEILHDMGYIEAALDDPEHISLEGFSDTLLEKTKKQISELEKILSHFQQGRMKAEGINTVIVGKPNAGKSSLMNLLLDQERAIVTDIAGTTRDALEERVQLGSLMLNLVDTAGIRDTEDVVEHMGVNRAIDYIQKSDFIIYVVDSTTDLDEDDFQIIDLIKDREGVILLNKSDKNDGLSRAISGDEMGKYLSWKSIIFSNKTKNGLKELEKYLENAYFEGKVQFNDQIYLTNIRQKEAVKHAVDSLKNVKQSIEDGMPEDFYTIDMMDAYRSLGLINGETASEDLVNKIFSEFCMGK